MNLPPLEHGMGFAVVSEEARNLAPRVSVAVKEASDLTRVVAGGNDDVVGSPMDRFSATSAGVRLSPSS